MNAATSSLTALDFPGASVPAPRRWPRVVVRASPSRRGSPSGRLGPFPDNTNLVAGLVDRNPAAWDQLLTRFGSTVERVVGSVLGIDPDFADVVQEVFMHIMQHIHQLRDAPALKNWIATVAVFTARGHIRRRRRGRWLRSVAPCDLPDVAVFPSSDDSRSLVQSTYRALSAMPAKERLVFSLRFIAGMELTEVATSCAVSLATVKRWLSRAEGRFLDHARRDPALNEMIARGGRWAAA